MWKSDRLTGLLPLVLLYSCKRILIDSFVTPFKVRTTHNIFLSSVWCHNNDVNHSGKDYETIQTFETYWKVFEFLHQEVHFYRCLIVLSNGNSTHFSSVASFCIMFLVFGCKLKSIAWIALQLLDAWSSVNTRMSAPLYLNDLFHDKRRCHLFRESALCKTCYLISYFPNITK